MIAASKPPVLWPRELPDVSAHQHEQWSNACANRLAVLTGGPGTGKTHVVSRLVKRLLEAGHLAEQIACAAPSGKAAVRITEQLGSAGIRLEATTIHRLLGVQRNGRDGNGWAFQFNAGNRLPAKFVIIDETSMCETELLAKLLAALPDNAHLLLVGDIDQLPPVGHGAPLRDLLNRVPKFQYARLTEVKRNGGAILDACADIRDGRRLTHPSISSGNWLHVETANEAQQIERIRTLVERTPSMFDRVWDVQVLCARNENGQVNRNLLNTVLRTLCNPPNPETDASTSDKLFRVDDKLICTSNTMLLTGEHYEQKTPKEILATEFVANGELCRVLDVREDRMLLRMLYPEREVMTLNPKLIDSDFSLGYAITTHKSQGSEFPVVILAIDDGGGLVAGREWYYTAFSRARKTLITVGKLATMNKQIKKQHLPERKTMLFETMTMI